MWWFTVSWETSTKNFLYIFWVSVFFFVCMCICKKKKSITPGHLHNSHTQRRARRNPVHSSIIPLGCKDSGSGPASTFYLHEIQSVPILWKFCYKVSAASSTGWDKRIIPQRTAPFSEKWNWAAERLRGQIQRTVSSYLPWRAQIIDKVMGSERWHGVIIALECDP